MPNIHTKIQLVNTIFQISEKYNKHYCFPTQNTLQNILKSHYGISKSIRTINRWLRQIEDKKLIKRVRRIRRSPEHGFEFRSTLYFLTARGLKILNKFGYDVWDKLSQIYDKSIRLKKLAKNARIRKNVKRMTTDELIKIRQENYGVFKDKKSPA